MQIDRAMSAEAYNVLKLEFLKLFQKPKSMRQAQQRSYRALMVGLQFRNCELQYYFSCRLQNCCLK